MTEPIADNVDRPWFLLCEGPSDAAFLEALVTARNIDVPYQIRPAKVETKDPKRPWGYGRGVFTRYMNSLTTSEGFLQNVRGVLVLTDNDTPAAVTELKAHLGNIGFNIPAESGVVALTKGKPPVAFYLLPPIGNGNLESVCLDAAYSRWNVQHAVDAFIAATPANDFPPGKQAKAKVQSLLAATNGHQPDAGFGVHFNQPEDYRIPLDHDAFNALATYLTDFPALVDAAVQAAQ